MHPSEAKLRFRELDTNENWLYTYNDELFTGVAYDYVEDPNDESQIVMISETEFVNGNMSGINREWYESGKLKSEATMKDGAGHGYIREWYENGQLKEETLAEWGVRLYSKAWDEAGNLIKDYKLDKSDTFYEILTLRRERWGKEIDWEPEQ